MTTASPERRRVADNSSDIMFSQQFACSFCGISFDELAPRNFSFNSPYGACERCDGLGTHLEVDSDLVINEDISIDEGAIGPWSGRSLEYFDRLLDSAGKAFGFRTDVPFNRLSKKARDVILFGSDDTEIHVRYRNRFNRVRSYWTAVCSSATLAPCLLARSGPGELGAALLEEGAHPLGVVLCVERRAAKLA